MTLEACRPALFKKSMRRFNVAWWAYSFPLTFLALATVEYAKQVKGIVAPVLMLMLSVLSLLVFLSLMVFTALNTNAWLALAQVQISYHSSSNFGDKEEPELAKQEKEMLLEKTEVQ
ncbi:hypothetical protein HYC85_015432 [Camellia sinensis]|uniref:Uncharacterized protein n=1 Tax=Camellia sinensis TaxID=4442 RepID=A0A7J7H0F0_CAMSI|nr:hypothetical protein HYC85_015432 [Camellia sinensis]